MKTLHVLLQAIESNPAAHLRASCLSAIRRQGVHLTEVAGANGLRTALERVAALVPQHAEDRRTIVSAAWAGLPDWSDRL